MVVAAIGKRGIFSSVATATAGTSGQPRQALRTGSYPTHDSRVGCLIDSNLID